MDNQCFLSMMIHISDQLIHQRITNLVGCSIGSFQIFRCFQSCRRYHNISLHVGNLLHILQSVSHSITDCRFSLRCKTFPNPVCRSQITDILRCHAKDSDPARNHVFLFPCKYQKQLLPCFLFAFVIQLHAICIHGQNRKIYFSLCHPL